MSAGNAREGGAARRHRRGTHEEEHVNHERWLISYGDMLTVLLGLFIVLFAMSQIDAGKYDQLRNSLAHISDQSSEQVIDGGNGPLTGSTSPDGVEAPDVSQPIPGVPSDVDPKTLEAAKVEIHRLHEIEAQLRGALTNAGLADRVQFRIEKRGLVVGMVSDDVFFTAGSADLSVVAAAVLDTAAPTLRSIPDEISVEGHANIIPASGRYATNWELSSDRATQVLRRLVEAGGVPAPRIAAVGYGDARPMVAGTSPEAMAANRRVDLVVLSSAPDDVRNLLTALDAAGQN